MKDEWRVKKEMKVMAVAEGMYDESNEPVAPGYTVYNQNMQSTDQQLKFDGSMLARKTAYAAN